MRYAAWMTMLGKSYKHWRPGQEKPFIFIQTVQSEGQRGSQRWKQECSGHTWFYDRTWLLMTMHGCLWLFMAAFGRAWLDVAAHGCLCLCMIVYDCAWLIIVVYDCLWPCIFAYNPAWLFIAMPICL